MIRKTPTPSSVKTPSHVTIESQKVAYEDFLLLQETLGGAQKEVFHKPHVMTLASSNKDWMNNFL